MAYKVSLKKSALKELADLDRPVARKLLAKIEEILPHEAASFPLLKGEFAGMRKFRVGNYRIIFTLSGNEALILRIAHRKDVYRTDLD